MKGILCLILSLNLLFSTTLYGEIFEAEKFTKLNNTIIKIKGDTTLQITANKNYSLDIPKGNYTLMAMHFEGNTLKYYTEESLNLNQEIMQYDIILYPEELRQILPNETKIMEEKKDEESSAESHKTEHVPYLLLIIILLTVAIAYLMLNKPRAKHIITPATKKETRTIEKQENHEQEEKEELDEDCTRVLKILKENDGRMEQKELRDILKFSETKMSLVVAELETINKIKKIKKGRQNILKLKN